MFAFTTLALAAGTTFATQQQPQPAPSAIPPEVRAVIDAAIASGDDKAVAAVMRFATEANPAAAAEIESIHAAFRQGIAARVQREQEAEKERLANAGPFQRWDGQFELGASRSTGSTNSLGVYGALSGERQGIDWRHSLIARAEIQETNGQRTAQRIVASWQPRYRVDDRFYFFGIAQYEHDPFLGFDSRYDAGLGGGYSLIASDDVRLDVEGGPTLRRTDPMEGGTDRTIAGRASMDLRWAIAPTVELKQNSVYLVDEFTETGRATTSLDTRVIGPLRLRLSYELRYEREVPMNQDSLDTASRATFVVGF